MPQGWKTRLYLVIFSILASIYMLAPSALGLIVDPTTAGVTDAPAPPVAPAPQADETTAAPEASATVAAAVPEATATTAAAPRVSDPGSPDEKRTGLAAWLPNKKLRLGLDLVGGTHLILDVKTQEALEVLADGRRRALKDALAEANVPAESLVRDPVDRTKIILTLTNSADRDKAKEVMREKVSQAMEETEFREEAGKGVLVFAFTQERMAEVTDDAVTRALEILRSRVDEFGVAEPLIYRGQGSRIVIQLPGLKDPEAAIRTIKRTARLEFRMLKEDWYQSLGEVNANTTLAGWVNGAIEKLGPNATDREINQHLASTLPEGSDIFFEKIYDPATKTRVRVRPLLVASEVGLSGEKLEDAYPSVDNLNRPVVAFQMSPEGSVEFGNLTEKNVGNRMAIILEGEVKSYPSIREKITDRGQISLGAGNREQMGDEAFEISRVLRSGALPAPVTIEQNWTVGPSLGQDSIEKGAAALKWGALAVILFMALWYKKSGVLADVAVLINVLCLMALMALFGFTLTLPGIAGVVLTIGMAVDSNVLIYERIREELRAGKNVRASTELGFEQAFSSIVDGNLTTATAGFVLYYFGTGPIQGFALTLLIGIATTLFAALVVTRCFFDIWVFGMRPEKLSI